jgi:hypothetical protein
MDMPMLLTDGDFDLIYDRLPVSFVAGVEARLAQNDAPICAYEFLARSIPRHVQQELKAAFDEAAEAIGQLYTERFGNAVVDLDDAIQIVRFSERL